jgi:hypothetical protein
MVQRTTNLTDLASGVTLRVLIAVQLGLGEASIV